MTTRAPELTAGVSTVDVFSDGSLGAPWRARVASVLEAGLVLTNRPGDRAPSLRRGVTVQLMVTNGETAHEARGQIAGSSEAGVAIELSGAWQVVDRRGFPRAVACLPMRFRTLEPKMARQVATAIQSRITQRPVSRPSELPYERGEMAALNARLQKIERAIDLLTDLVLWAGTGQSPLEEREVVLSASGLSLELNAGETLPEGALVELELLLPLRDPVRVRALGNLVRVSADGDQGGRAAIKFDTIDEADRDEVARYVFQLQRRRQKSTLM